MVMARVTGLKEQKRSGANDTFFGNEGNVNYLS